jgi:cobalt-zinc-cadmium efflux system outer membrane protein
MASSILSGDLVAGTVAWLSAPVFAGEYQKHRQQRLIYSLATGVRLRGSQANSTSLPMHCWDPLAAGPLGTMFTVRIIAILRNRDANSIKPATHSCALLLAAVVLCSKVATAQTTLSLHSAIQRAMGSAAVQVANAHVEEIRGGLRQAGLGPNPRLYLQSEDLRPWAENFSFPTQTEDYGYLGQSFELAGKRGKRVELASARLQQAEAERAMRMRQVAASVSAAYWNAVSLQRISDLLAEDLAAVDKMVRYHKERVDNGAMKGVDLLRMQIERDRLAITLAGAQRDATQGRLEIFRQMGMEPDGAVLSDSLDAMPQPEPSDLQNALLQRPEIASARYAVQAAEADLRLQKANGVPDTDILAGYKRNNGDNTIYASLQIQLPFRNRNQGEVERAGASVTAAKATLLLAQAQVSIEIRQAQAAFASQQTIVRETLPDMRAHAQQNLDIITEAYRLGGIDLLRFIDAERTELDVEVSAVRALAQLQQSAIQLKLAYGVQP